MVYVIYAGNFLKCHKLFILGKSEAADYATFAVIESGLHSKLNLSISIQLNCNDLSSDS